VPDSVPRLAINVRPRAKWIKLRKVEELGAIHVSDPSDHGLIHQQRRYRLSAPRKARIRNFGLCAATKRIGTKTRKESRSLVTIDELASCRSDEIGVPILDFQPHPHIGAGTRGRLLGSEDFAKQSQMHVDVSPAVELVEQMLAVSLNVYQ
jgi:hypothetical protein